MSVYAFSGLINGLVATICGATVYYHNHKSTKNTLYALYCVSLSVWSYFYCAWQLTSDPSLALFFCRGLMMGAIFIPVFHYHHILSLFDLGNKSRRIVLHVSYLFTGLFCLSNLTPLFISRVEPRLGFPAWPVPGPLFHPYLAMFGGLLALSIRIIWEFRNKKDPVIKNAMAWVAFATLLGYGGGATNFPLWYGIPLKPIFNITVSIYIAINALLFFKLKILDIQLFLRNMLAHVSTSLILGGSYSILVFLVTRSVMFIVFTIVFAIFIPFIFPPFYRWILGKVNMTRLGKVDEYLEIMDASLDKVRETTYTYDALAENLVDAVMNTFPVEMAGVYFLDTDSKEFYLRSQRGMQNPLANDLKLYRADLTIKESDPFVQYMTGRKEVVVKEEIKASPLRRAGDEDVIKRLEEIEGEVSVPFLFSKRVFGILVMGKKKGNNMYHGDDIQAVYSFGRMGEEIMRYIMGMEHEVRHASLYSHDMNNSTKSLVQTLQFVRSPLGKMAKPEKVDQMLLQAEDVATRLNQSFTLNRDRSALILKSIKGQYEKNPVELVRLIRESCGKFSLTAEEKQVNLDVSYPSSSIMVEGNADDLVRMMDNLISNALRYVKSGGKISVDGEETPRGFKITVTDDGEGIAPEVIERIWDYGWQVKDSKQGASGLGLAIVKQIVQLHGGAIQVESSGKNKGTRFTVIIPMLSLTTKESMRTGGKENGS